MVMTTSASLTALSIESAALPPASTERRCVLVPVEADDRVAGLDQIVGHRAAHDAEPDESDCAHWILVSCVWTCWFRAECARGSGGSQSKVSVLVALYSRPT